MRYQRLLACALVLSFAGTVAAQQAKPAAPAPATGGSSLSKMSPPIRGEAELGYTKPATKRTKDEIITTMKVKNMSTTNSIVGLKVDEYWYDKAGDPVSGDSYRHRKPLGPGEVLEITLRSPVNTKMDRNQYKFEHANGAIKTKPVPKL